nr:hypothetical protein [uncultured Mediterranean phage uvMED]
MPRPSPTGKRAGARADSFDNWVPFAGEYKTIQLPRGAGSPPPMTIEQYLELHPEHETKETRRIARRTAAYFRQEAK